MAEITHVVDIGPWARLKRAAIASHHTQTGDGGPLSEIPPEVFEWQLAREFFVRAPLPWAFPEAGIDILETLASERGSA
jgi:LmbE family N-acetylglucosaminyl deacetylase